MGLSATSAWALPQDPQVVHGQAQISNQAQAVMQILQSSPQAIINWSQFNIAPGEIVRFLQPGSSSSILNRVTGVDPSVIQGLLQGNGRVFLLNPNGILFGPGSVVDVGSFMASTLHMSDADFLSGRHNLTQSNSLPMAALVNQGTIKVAEGGFVVLVSPLLDNAGVILAQSGQVQLGATREATFSVDGQGLVQFVVPDGFDPQFTGGGQGGTVLVQQNQMSQLLSQVIQNPNVVEAGQLQAQDNDWLAHGSEGLLLNSGTISVDGKVGQQAGSIRLDSSGATILTPGSRLSANGNQADAGQVLALSAGPTVSLGTIEAASQGAGDGGFVEVSGRLLSLHGAIDVRSQQGQNGQVLLDPGNLTIVDAGPGTLDGSLPNILEGTGGPNNHSVSTSAIAAISGAVTLEATNDITYTTATGFSAPNTDLTVSAGNNIVFTGTGGLPITTRSLHLDAGQDLVIQSGGTTTLTANTGSLSLTGGRNVTVNAPSNLVLSSPVSTSIQGGNDVFVSSGIGGNSMTLTGPNTTVAAGQDLTFRSNNINTTTSNVTLSAVRDLNFVTHPGTTLTASVGALNATAGRDLDLVAGAGLSLTASQGDLRLIGARNATVAAQNGVLTLAATQGATRIQAQDVQVSSTSVLTVSGNTTAHVNATQGNAGLSSSSSNIGLQSANGPVVVNATGNATVNATGNLGLSSPVSTSITGGNDVFVSSGVGGNSMTLTGPNTSVTAGQDLTFRSNNINPTTSNVTLSAVRDLNFVTHPATTLTASVGALNATAGRDLDLTAGGGLSVTASQGDLRLTGARNATITAESGLLTLAATQGATRIQAQDIQVSSTSVLTVSGNATAHINATQGNTNLSSSSSNIGLQSASGPVVVNASGNTTVNATGNLGLSSPVSASIRGGNDVFVSSGVGGNSMTLTGPNMSVTAGQDLTFRSNNINPTTSNVNLSAVRDLSFVTHPSSSLTASVGSFNATAGRDLELTGGSSFVLTATQGDLRLTGGRNATVSAEGNILTLGSGQGATRIQAQDVDLNAVTTLTVGGNTTAHINATQGNVNIRSSLGSINLQSSNGPVAVNASGDTTVNASSGLGLSSPISTTIQGGNDVFVSSGVGGNSMTLTGPNTSMAAGQDLTLRSNFIPATTSNVTLNAVRDLSVITHSNGSLSASVGSFTATAGQDLEFTGASSFVLTASQGDLLLSGARNATVATQGDTLTLQASQGTTRIQAQDVELRAQTTLTVAGNTTTHINATQGNVNLLSGFGTVSLSSSNGPVVVSASGNATVNAPGNLGFSSPISSSIIAGNDVVVTSGAAGNSANLSGPNTTIAAGQDLTLRSNIISQSVSGNVTLNAVRDLNVVNHLNSSMTANVGALNATAGRDLNLTGGLTANLTASQGDLLLIGARNTTVASQGGSLSLTASQGATRIQGQDVQLSSVVALTVSGNTTTQVNATQGNANLNSGSTLTLQSANGPVVVNAASGNATVNTTASLLLSSPVSTLVNASNDVAVATGVFGNSANLSGPNTTLAAGQDLSVRSNSIFQSVSGNVSLSSGRDLSLGSNPSSSLTANAESLNATAGRDLTTTVSGNFGLTAPSGANFTAVRDLRMQNGSTTLNSAAGNIALQAGNNLDLSDTGSFQINAVGAVIGTNNTAEFRSGSTINTGAGGVVAQSANSLNTTLLALNSSTGNVSAQAGANLTVGNISAPNVNLNANNITLQSFQNLGGANYTINATQALREITPAATGPSLTNLNITAGSIFGNGNNSSFSVPDASQDLFVTVTGGNDTSFQAAASMSQINGANISLLTTPQTGDIYVDGILLFQGSPPPEPPPPPPPPDPPPPIPQPLPAPQPLPEVGLTDIELAELRAAVAQSNIMMGNLGSFSRVLEPQEKERMTVRQDSLRHTSLIDPFSPTLALVVGSNVDWMRAGEMSSFMATFNEELRDKDSPAFNAMVDQEVREIWEVRYWRHLLEGFVIWEDPE